MKAINTIADVTDEVGDAWAESARKYVVPVVGADHKGGPDPIGSLVLAHHLETRFFVTANHVMIHNEGDEATSLYTYLPLQFPIVGTAHRIANPYDIALIEVPGLASFHVGGEFDFIATSGDLVHPTVKGHTICLVIGFPIRDKAWHVDNKESKLIPKPFIFLGTVSSSDPRRLTISFSPRRTFRSAQKQPEIGSSKGISGGGVFVFNEGFPRLAGIVIEYHKQKSEIVATSSAVVWKAIMDTFPNLPSDKKSPAFC